MVSNRETPVEDPAMATKNKCITVCVAHPNDILVLDYVAGVLVSFDEE
jgi:hypothetical protein